MTTFNFFIAHNDASHALPELISASGKSITFYPEKINADLWKKLNGKIEIVKLTKQEATEILSAKRGMRNVSRQLLINVGLIKDVAECDLYSGNMGDEMSAPC